MRLQLSMLALCVALSLSTSIGAPAANAPQVGAGWWVVLEVVPASANQKPPDPEQIRSTARRCGNFTIFNEPSSKFKEFQAGYNVFLIGPIAMSRVAEQTKSALVKCFPNDFVKYGEFTGE